MKILRLSTFLDFGGVESRLANISYVQDNNEWVFMCMNNEGRAAKIIKNNFKKVINLQTIPSIYSIRTFFEVYKFVKKENPDVVHTSGAEANFHGILAARLAGVRKVVGEEIGIPNHGIIARFVFSVIFKLADHVVGNSDAVLKAVCELNKVPRSKIRKIENPIIFKEIPSKDKRVHHKDFKILMVSRLEPVKNIAGVLDVLSRLINEMNFEMSLVIAGAGSIQKDLEKKVIELKLERSVIFAGFVTNPYHLLSTSDLYILNSFSEGFSNSLIEAMYSKTICLSTNVGAAPEIIKEGENGFLVSAGDDNMLFEKIKYIYNMDEEQRITIASNAHRKIVESFSLETHIGKLMELYTNQS